MNSIKKQDARPGMAGKIPGAVSDYIRENFRGDFLSDIKVRKNKKGELSYAAAISHDNTMYYLRFDSQGNLVNKEMEDLVEGDDEYV